MKYPLSVNNFKGSLKNLAKEISVMRYDKIVQLFSYLTKEFNNQSISDARKNRNKLAGMLKKIAECQNITAKEFKKIWEFCKPYMKK